MSAEPTARPVVLDEKRLSGLERMIGREDLQALIRSFLADVPERLAAITAPGAEQETIKRESHALVSLAGNLGLVELSSASRALTDACGSGEQETIPALVQNLVRASRRAAERLEALLAT